MAVPPGTRSGLGGDEPWRVGTEVYGDRDQIFSPVSF